MHVRLLNAILPKECPPDTVYDASIPTCVRCQDSPFCDIDQC